MSARKLSVVPVEIKEFKIPVNFIFYVYVNHVQCKSAVLPQECTHL
jgi:hypothetical protein